jgi:hypothetical protein
MRKWIENAIPYIVAFTIIVGLVGGGAAAIVHDDDDLVWSEAFPFVATVTPISTATTEPTPTATPRPAVVSVARAIEQGFPDNDLVDITSIYTTEFSDGGSIFAIWLLAERIGTVRETEVLLEVIFDLMPDYIDGETATVVFFVGVQPNPPAWVAEFYLIWETEDMHLGPIAGEVIDYVQVGRVMQPLGDWYKWPGIGNP